MWSCGGKLRVPLRLCVDLGDPSCLHREVRSPLALRGEPRDSSHFATGINRASSLVDAGTSGFLSFSDFHHRISAELEQESQASSCVEEWNSACLSNCSGGDSPLVELYLEPVAFSGRCNSGVSAPLCCDFILRVTFEECPSIRTYLEWTGKLVSFGMWHEP